MGQAKARVFLMENSNFSKINGERKYIVTFKTRIQDFLILKKRGNQSWFKQVKKKSLLQKY